jgi:hypothetical protein
MRRPILSCVLATCTWTAAPALADPPPADAAAQPPRVEPAASLPEAPPAPAAPVSPAGAPTWRTTGTWGWLVLGTGVAAGAALTTYGLTFDCGDDQHPCQRRASIAIWGGLGIAALSSAVGIAIVQNGKKQVTLAPTASSGRAPGGGVVLCGTF